MKQYHGRKRTGRKKSIRLLSVMLCFCLLITACPYMPGAVVVHAAGGQENGKAAIIQTLLDRIAALTKEQQALVSEEALAKLTAWAEIAEGTVLSSAEVLADHSHPVCGASCSHSGTHDSLSWQTFTSTGGELEAGNYYLTENVNLQTQLTIPSGTEVNLCLNGKTLCGLESNDAIKLNGALTVCDCSNGRTGVLNCGGTSTANEAVIMEGGVLNLYGGKLTGNSPYSIIYVRDGGTANLFGGMVEGGSRRSINNAGNGTVIISGNSVVSGGKGSSGCAVLNNYDTSVLTVKDNASLSSEGQGVRSYGIVNIEGGTITSTKTDGYGIENLGGVLNITSGTITGNKYGVYMEREAAALNLSGSLAISGTTADLYLQTASGATLDNVKVDATGYTGNALSVEECSTSGREGAYAIKVSEGSKDKFTLTNVGEVVYQYKDGGLMLHTHDYTYAASDKVITESCANNCGHSATATLILKDGANLTYTGSEIKPVTVKYSDNWVGTGAEKPDDTEIAYTDNKNAGTATAKLTIASQAASLNFDIAPAEMSDVSVSGYTGTYDGSAHGIKVTAAGATVKYGTAEGNCTLTSSPTYTDAGTYTVYYQVTKTNYITKTGSAQIKISAKSLTDDMITLASGPHFYTGSEIKPVVTLKDDGRTVASSNYDVSYSNNTNVGTATVTVVGKGNYTGTINNLSFTIGYRPLPSGKSLTDYITISPEPTNSWYGSDITLTPKSGYEVGKTSSGMGSNAVTISQETGTDGSTKTIYIKDGGNIYQTEFFYKLDKTPPVVDLTNMTVENGTKNLRDWIIGKKSMMIKIPVAGITETLSGVAEVSYTAESGDGTAQTKTVHAQDGYYEIALNAEFSGTIKLAVKDKAGNTTQASLTADSGKVIAEDNAPVVTFTLPDTLTPNADGWYHTDIEMKVTVTDDKDSNSGTILSGGIAAIRWKDGESGTVQTVSGLPGNAPAYEKEFTISVNTDGMHTYYVNVVDNAGNESGWQTATVKVDTGNPVFSGNVTVTDPTEEGADITFTPSEGGKVYWIVSDIGTAPTAQEVKEQSGQKGGVKDVTGGTENSFTITGLGAGEKHTVYVVLEDAVGNLSEVKTESFLTLRKAPEITLEQLTVDYTKETIKLPDNFRDVVEVYTDPQHPEHSKITPNADGLPVTPGSAVYIRYPEKTVDSMTVPASDKVKIQIPGRPDKPAAKQVTVTDTTAAVKNPASGEEYALVKKGNTPDWSKANTTGQFTGLDPNQEYDLYVRKKATENSFASEPAKTEIRMSVVQKEEKPDIRIDYRKETLTGFIRGEKYVINVKENTVTITAASDGTMKLGEGWLGTTVSIVKCGNGKDKLDSDALSLTVPARSAQAPSPQAVDESRPGAADGKLTGLEADQNYQISTDNGATWTDTAADKNGEITKLAPGSYLVRESGTDSAFAGRPSGKVTIAAGQGTRPETEHKYPEQWTVEKEATEKEPGRRYKICETCGTKIYRTIDPSGTPADPYAGKIEKEVEVLPGAPDTVLNNSKEELAKSILTPEEIAEVENGTDAKIWLEIAPDADISEKEKAQVQKAAEESVGAGAEVTYFDASLFKQIGNGEKTIIHEPGRPVSVTIVIPEDIRNKDVLMVRNYHIIRLHDGKTDFIEGTYNEESAEFTFETDKFSVYAICYKDSPKQVTPETQAPGTALPTPGGTAEPGTPTPVPGETAEPGTPTPVPGGTAEPGTPTPVPDESGQTGNEIEKRKDLSILLATGMQKGSAGIKLTWLKWKGASGYEVYWSYCDGKKNYKKLKTVKAKAKRTYTHKKLKKNRAYKYYIAAYKMMDGNKKYVAKSPTIHVAMKYEKRTNAKKITADKTKVILSLTNKKYKKTFKIRIKVKKENRKRKLLSHAAELRYYTDDKKVAKVSKTGKITAKGKGKCTVYVVANNGVYKKITLTVK